MQSSMAPSACTSLGLGPKKLSLDNTATGRLAHLAGKIGARPSSMYSGAGGHNVLAAHYPEYGFIR